jgi:hypothetical protein
MTITSAGNVGIGTITPNIVGFTGTMLTVNGTGNYQGFEVATSGTSRIIMLSDGTNGYISTRQSGMGLIFETGAASQKMAITSAGAVGINTSSPSGRLDVNGRVYIRTAGSSTDAAITFINQSGGDGTLFVTGTSTSLNYGFSTYSVSNAFYLYNNGNYDFVGSDVSDRRLKENIITINYNATEKLMQLVPKSYNMIAHPSIKKSGFIAQEVKEILPDFVTGEETAEDYLGIDYNGILALAIKAIQELKTQNDALQSRIETLESK